MSPHKFARPAMLALALGLGLVTALGPTTARADDEPDSKQEKRVRIITEDRDDPEQEGKGYLGVLVQDLTRSLRRAKNIPGTNGALVSRVEDGSPADRAGIETGDVIVEVDRDPASGASDLTSKVRGLKPGSRVDVMVIRDGHRKTLQVTVGERPSESESDDPLGSWEPGNGSDPDMKNFPTPPRMSREFVLRHQNLERQLEQIREQLTRLRDEDLASLQEELRALREELHRSGLLREGSGSRRDRSGPQREDD